MARINRESGLQIKVPSGYGVGETVAPASPMTRNKPGFPFASIPVPLDPVAVVVSEEAVVAAFCGQDMQLVDQVVLEPGPPAARSPRRRGAKSASGDETAELALTLAPLEDAVVLVEQGGVYTWEYSSQTKIEANRTRKRDVPVAPARRFVRFQIKLPPGQVPAIRPAPRGIIGDFVRDKIKVFVFKFTARVAVGRAMKFLERNVRRGLVGMSDTDPALWTLIADPATLMPEDRPARILLFLHGTFSSTIGAYGGLTATPWGQEFLRTARVNYDTVIGFDHATLSEDPLENASDLLNRLQGVVWPYPPRFDVIAHGRGGLVLRSLTEHLLPIANFQARFERVIFVAATNGGTRLAEPKNWRTLIDLYTNLSVAACRLIGMMPQAKPITLFLNEIVQGLGALVKYCATTAITERGVPGLAAMEPDGDFIKNLNLEQVNQPTVANSNYFAVTSEFEPRIVGGDHEPKEFSNRLILWMADIFSTQLMMEANDLVVDTASMTSVDPQLGKYIKDSLDFGKNPQVYHTNYFIRPEVLKALVRWLRLVKPDFVPHLVESHRTATRGGKEAVKYIPTGVALHPDLVERGGVVGLEVPAAVDTNIIVMFASTPFDEAIESIRAMNPSYVVVRRNYGRETLDYAFSAEELISRGSDDETHSPLVEVLSLREHDRASTCSITMCSAAESNFPPDPAGSNETTRRVVHSGLEPIGVLPEWSELPNAGGLVELAKVTARPMNEGDRILTRRTMPTFAAPGADLAVTSPAVRPTRGGSRKFTNSTKVGVEPKVTCHFRTEMDGEILVKRPATVEVLISSEVIGQLIHASAAEGKAEIEPSRKLLIQVLPKVNFESVDEGWTEVDPPKPDEQQSLYFILRATHVGEGEVWVVARQGQVPLVTLVLKSRIVKARSQAKRRAMAAATTTEAPKLSSPLHQLVITERRNGDKTSYRYQFQSPALKLLKWGDSKPLVADRQNYVVKLYEKIEDRWLSNQQDSSDFLQELRAIGAEMFNELIPPDVQQVFWEYRDKIESILVIAEEPFIPWELVHLCEPGRPLSDETRFLGQMGLVRWLHEAGWPNERISIRPGKARYVIPDYPHADYKLPEAQLEVKFLESNLKAIAVEPKSSTVRNLLAQPGAFDLLHFACHGVAEQDNISNAQLLMQGRIEGGNYVFDSLSATTTEAHANLKSDGQAPMIVLNACQAGRAGYKLTGVGGFAQAFLRRGAVAFVGTLWSVGDSPARHFTEEFYTQLLKEKVTIAEAAVRAREKARKEGDATWLAYVVYGHPHAKLHR